MAWKREDNIDLKKYSTMRIGGVGKCLITTNKPEKDLLNIFSDIIQPGDSYHVVGEGSNSIFGGDFPNTYFIALENKDITIISDSETETLLRVGGGLCWDQLVAYSIEHNLQGIEMLSAIPGTVAAAPIQNIGAYGGEFSDVCVSVHVFDTVEKKYSSIPSEKCDFGYRSSMFKKEAGRHVIYAVDIGLSKTNEVKIPEYPGVHAALFTTGIEHPTLADIRTTIIDIRWSKLPRPEILANCGSFFKNTYTTREQYDSILKSYPDCIAFPQEDGGIKIPTGWLIDTLGLKQHRVGDIGLYEKHALIIVNHGKGTFIQLQQFITDIQKKVFDAFGIQITPEVNIIMPYENT
ncbi:UDP-N-acetylmuramate dehydrogenase [Candidatus Nomurabacteria bacterium]|nr:UDP-N-acetylmuramate dehydrogenase [Candidatus Nomurabacteria bacterium]